ncbi:MAG: hypothetical protein RI894_6, partial [Bacteroidota bacterium]
MSQLPTALFLFTDAHGCRLPDLPLEANAVQDLFAWCSDRVVYAPHRYNFARRDLANSLAADANTLALFHIAGHNTPEGILVTNDDSSETILSAKILNAYLDTCENLQLVFLNACQSLATAAQLSAKPLVRIGTVIDIDDNAAADASRLFYHAMLKGQNLKTAFDLLNARYKEITDTDSNAYTALWKNDAAQTVVLFAAKKGTENTTETGDIILGNKIVNYYASTDAPSIAKLPPISRLAPILLDENGMLIGRKNALDALQEHIEAEPNDLV